MLAPWTSRLSAVLISLMALQSLLGLSLPEAYRDNVFVKSAWHGNDWITLLAAVPLMAVAHMLANRGSLRAALVWNGCAAYALYNYSFYLFGAVLSAFFLIYVALLVVSAYALIFGLAKLDLGRVSAGPAKGVSAYMFVWGVFLSGLWISQSLGFVLTGQVPAMVTATAHPTNITAALDLSIMVPAVLAGAVLLWRGSAWGTVIGVLMNVKGALYALALAAGSWVGAQAGVPDVGGQIPLWICLSLASLVCCYVLLKRADVG